MPPLPNPRHERFAQGLAKGKTADAAYADAGFKPNRGNATTLKAKQSVQDRVAELQERAAVKVELTVADIIAELEQARSVALAAQTPQAGSAVAASMGKAKLLGLVVDKSVKADVSLEELLGQLDAGEAGPSTH